MPPTLTIFLHVAFLFLFVAMVQRALAAPGARKGTPLVILVVVGVLGMGMGFARAGQLQASTEWWVLVKAVLWLGVLCMPFIVRKKPTKAMPLTLTTILFVVAAIWVAYYHPYYLN